MSETNELDWTKPVEVPVRGLHCGGCVARLEKVLAHQPGVLSVKVDLLTAKAELSLAGAGALPGALAAIEGAGFYPGSAEQPATGS